MQLNKQIASMVDRFNAHLHVPLFRNGYALVSSSFLSSAIGMFYWILAARLYPANLVGLNSAMISAMMLLGGIAQLNMTNAHIRFIPTAGRSTRRFVAITYIIGPLVAILVTMLFIEFMVDFSPTLGFIGSFPLIQLIFILGTMGWCIFVIEDGVLTGLRSATWVPVENSMFGLIKIALLILLATILPSLGVYASWVIGLGIIIGPTTYFIFRKLIPAHISSNPQTDSLPAIRTIARYTAGDYVATLAWLACTSLTPIIVTSLAGPTANAYYFLPWQIALLLYAVSGSMGSSLVVEASTTPKDLWRLSFRVMIQLMMLVVPLALVIILGAPLILRLFGRNYVESGTPVLRLLALSAIPYIVLIVFASIARVQRKISNAAYTYGALSILVLSLSYILLPSFGIVGVGLAWLGANTIVASVILMIWLRKAIGRSSHENPVNSPVIQFGGMSILDPGSGKYPLISLLARPWRAIENGSRFNQGSALFPAILERIAHSTPKANSRDWGIQYMIQTQTDMAIFAVGPLDENPKAIVKLPLSKAAAISARHQKTAIELIQSLPQLSQLQALLPKQLYAGEIDGQVFQVEEIIPGVDGRTFMPDPEVRPGIQSCAVDVITSLHEATAAVLTIDTAILQRWVDQPADRISRVISQIPRSSRLQMNLRRLSSEMKMQLSGREVALSWVHGDYVPGNILVSADGLSLTGIVDWELAHPADLPAIDIYQLILASRRETQNTELGVLTRKLLIENSFSAQENQLVKMNQDRLPGEPIDFQTMLLLFWIQHINANLTKSSRYDRHWVWIFRNIIPVLEHFG